MQVSVTFRHMDPTQALKEFAAEKVAKIQKYVHAPADAHVVLSVEKYMHKADITIKAHGMLMRGKEKSEDMYASIDRAMSKSERQVKRYKDRLAKHQAKQGQDAKVKLNILEAARGGSYQGPLPTDDGGNTLPPEITEAKEVEARRMSVDEAIMQMDLLHNDFLVFVNDRTASVNVLYRRPEGNFGLIETPQQS